MYHRRINPTHWEATARSKGAAGARRKTDGKWPPHAASAGRSSDRLGGRCSVCQSVPSAVSVRSSRAVRCTGKRGGAGKRGGGRGGGGSSGTRGRTDPDGAERPPGRPQEVTQEALHVCAKALGRVCCCSAPVKRMAVLAPAEGLPGARHAVRARYSDFAICSCGGVSQICQWYRVCDAGALRAEPLGHPFILRGHKNSPPRAPSWE